MRSNAELALASGLKLSVAGSQSSARYTGFVASLNPGPDVPPVTRTVPSGSSVALTWRRAMLMDATARHVGNGSFRLMTSAVAVGGSPPPSTRILPSAYITAEPYVRGLSVKVRLATNDHAPVPDVSR